mmetsp:Transcript_24773/g.73693  ORF Transcript_24773/g.73693 Transcript_24773/m.73693 type:complete len:269 (+) Transcript_24773:1-807(+)
MLAAQKQGVRLSALEGPQGGNDTEQELAWTKVQAFATRDEAIQFVVGCQPIDYMPDGYEGAWPHFEDSRKAYEHVMGLSRLPTEFVSVGEAFQRRLRVRRVESEELVLGSPAAGRAVKKLLSKRRKAQVASQGDQVRAAVKQAKDWHVEAAGVLFNRSSSQKTLKAEVGLKYFLAVEHDLERKVLAEGFRVARRSSIPCSARVEDAIQAFARHHPGVRASVLAVNLPANAGFDIVQHKRGGCLILAKELPPLYLSKIRRLADAQPMQS